MGKLEDQSRKRRRKGEIGRAILATLAVAGMLSVGLIAPKALEQLKYIPQFRNKFSYRSRTAAERLVVKGQAVWIDEDGKRFLRITEKGKREFTFEQAKVALLVRKKKRWDGRWRMVVFDVPERRRFVRFRLRSVMREIGFVRLQNSAWVYPRSEQHTS